ncbi:MAG: hypothetical protein AAF800_09910 [Planctomycetota bacterium]
MPAKLFASVAGLGLIAATLLALNQHRLATLHAMADLHVQMDHDRRATWDAQARIAEGVRLPALRDAVQRVGLDLRPLSSVDQDTPEAAAPAWPHPDSFAHAPAEKPRRGGGALVSRDYDDENENETRQEGQRGE